MDVELLSDVEGLEAEWWALWRSDPMATSFQSPAWLIPWRRQFQDGENVVLTGRREGRLAALLPMFRHDGRLLPWGAGTSDWLDAVVDPALDPAELAPMLEAAAEPLDLFQLPAHSRLLEAPLAAGWSERRALGESCVALDLPSTPSANLRQNLRYYRRRAEKAGVGEPAREGPGSFAELVELHSRRWKERDEAGVLADPRVLAWHEEALPRLEQAGLFRLYALRLRGRMVAALYALSAKQQAFYYIGGFDPDLGDLGLGTLLIGHAIAEAEREGARRFDFLRGQEPYKYRWGGADVATYARLLAPPGKEFSNER